MFRFLKPSLNWLLVFIPIAAWCEYGLHDATWTFVTACLGIIPVAGWMGRATEHLAERTGEGIGGLLNATFGNAAELIIALVALSKDMHEVVKASITGSIIGNLLLVLGASCLAGGLKHKMLSFSAAGVRAYASMLFLAAVALVLPATFHHLVGPAQLPAQVAATPEGNALVLREHHLSLAISCVLMITYALSLVFSLRTHKQLFIGAAAQACAVEDEAPHHTAWSVKRSLGVLFAATAVIAVLAEWLVKSVEQAAQAFGMSDIFVGVVVVAIVGNAAEHSTAILVAMKKRMDLALGVAVGSSIQIALFVAPVLVFASYYVGSHPLDLTFSTAEVLALVVAVLVTEQVIGDGETHWLEGVQLLSVYIVIAVMFYLLPAAGTLGT